VAVAIPEPMDDGEPDEPGEVVDPFVAYLAGLGLAERSILEYDRQLRRLARWLWSRQRVELLAITVQHVRDFADELPYTWSSRKQLRTALGHWQRWTQHPSDLTVAIRAPRKPKMQPRALEDDEAARLEEVAHDYGRKGLAVLLGLYLGMRRVEIAGASWTSWSQDHWIWQRAKTGDRAVLPVHPRLASALEGAPRFGPYLFPGDLDRNRAHVAPVTIWEWVKEVGAAAGVEVTTHQLRHTSITRVVDSMGIRVGQEWAGHRDPEVTAGYSRVPQRRLTEAMGHLTWSTPGPALASVASIDQEVQR